MAKLSRRSYLRTSVCPRNRWWRLSTLPLLLVAILQGTAAHGYEADVHFGLTRWLALMAGFSDSDANLIAAANNGRDELTLSAVPMVTLSACLFRSAAGANEVRNNHFATNVIAPNPPAARAISPGNEYAMRAARRFISDPDSDRRANLTNFSEKLHAVQDTWAHKNIPDVPGIWPLRCEATLAWSHSKDWGGWASHDADLTWRRPSDADAAAQVTYELLCEYRQKIDGIHCSKDWTDLRGDVASFSKLKTKLAKRGWFEKRDFKDLRFIERTSLPWDDPPAIPVPYLIALQGERSLSVSAPRDEVGQFFRKFLNWWAVSSNFDELVDVFISTEGFGIDPQGRQLMPFDREIAKLTLQYWRALDHGRVAELGHHVSSLSAPTRDALIVALATPGMLRPYESEEQAFLPVGANRAPFEVRSVQVPSGQEVYLAFLRFRHAANDALIISAQRSAKSSLRINAIQSLVDH
jgi:hypothetical protein